MFCRESCADFYSLCSIFEHLYSFPIYCSKIFIYVKYKHIIAYSYFNLQFSVNFVSYPIVHSTTMTYHMKQCSLLIPIYVIESWSFLLRSTMRQVLLKHRIQCSIENSKLIFSERDTEISWSEEKVWSGNGWKYCVKIQLRWG